MEKNSYLKQTQLSFFYRTNQFNMNASIMFMYGVAKEKYQIDDNLFFSRLRV